MQFNQLAIAKGWVLKVWARRPARSGTRRMAMLTSSLCIKRYRRSWRLRGYDAAVPNWTAAARSREPVIRAISLPPWQIWPAAAGGGPIWKSLLRKRQRCFAQGPQVRDKVCSLLLVLQTREKHICSRQGERGI